MKTVQLPLSVDDQESPEMVQTIQVEGLDEFIPLLLEWHQKQVAIVKHLMTVPEGIEVEVEGNEPFTLAGDTLRAFKMGLDMSLHYLGELPFAAEYEEDQPVH